MKGTRMIRNDNARCKNARNRQCKVQEYPEIVNVRRKNTRNRQ